MSRFVVVWFWCLGILPALAETPVPPVTMGPGNWFCLLYGFKPGDRFVSVLEPANSPLFCYTMRALEQYDAIGSDPSELSDVVLSKEKHLAETGKCQYVAPGVPHTVTSIQYNILTMQRADMPDTKLYFRKPQDKPRSCP